MKPLTLEETRLKEEMKNNCLKVGKYKDEKAKDKFEMLCHLEDFEVQYWELQKENEHLDWVNCHLRKTNEKLKERIAYLERSNNRRECTILEQRQEISDLEDKLSKIETLIINHNCDTGDIYYKYNGKFLKSELKQRILEILYEESDNNQ